MYENAGEHWDWPLIRKRCAVEALRMLRLHHDAEEVVQEALARAWRSRGSCRTPDAPLSWCLQITRNEALRLIGRQRSASQEPLGNRDVEDGRTGGEDERALVRVDVNRALQALTSHERLLINLRYEQDWSHPQIAAKLEIPEATARVRLHRAHKRLKTLLGEPA
jgi:RNA polymerase sigma factor (sigma-70 family)